MYFLRFIAVILGFLAAVVVSFISGIELFKVFALMGFLLVIDSLALRYLVNLYMKSVYEEMEKTQMEKRKNEKNDLSP